MSKSKTVAELKIEEFADEIKKQFEIIGNEAKEQLVNDFDKILKNDIDGLKEVLRKIVIAKTEDILTNSSNDLRDLVNKEFNGSIFGNILSNAILPNILNSNSQSENNAREFKPSLSQEFLSVAKVLAKSRARNS